MTVEEQARITKALEAEGYLFVKPIDDGRFIGMLRMAYTAGLFVMTEHFVERRYCYEHAIAAGAAAVLWDGKGDPPGPWIKEKPSERLGPGATE